MAEKTLPCSDMKEENDTSSTALNSNDFEFPSLEDLISLNKSNTKEMCEETRTRQLPLSLGSPEATEFFAERMARMRNDPESIPILAEIDARGPAAFLKFWEDKDVLKKLAKAATLGTAEGLNEDEQVSEGKKALNIAYGYAQMKYVKILLDAGAFDPIDRNNSKPRWAAIRARKKRVQCNKGDAIAPQNMEIETPIDVATTSSQCGKAA